MLQFQQVESEFWQSLNGQTCGLSFLLDETVVVYGCFIPKNAQPLKKIADKLNAVTCQQVL